MEIIDQAKMIISGYYSGEYAKMYIPGDIVGSVFSIACRDAKTVQQLCVFNDELYDDVFYRGAIENADTCSGTISQTIAFNYIKQIQQYPDIIAQKSSLKKSIIVLSNIDMEAMSQPFSFTVFDNKVAIILDADNNGGYFLTSDSEFLSRCRKWLEIPRIDEHNIRTSFLQEPLMFSADMMSEVASVLCTHDHMNMDGCYWYHSVWQYLRLMNMVSTPSWHHDFYVEQLAYAIEPFSHPRVLISGAADYSSLSYAIKAVKQAGKACDFSVIDLCETPLFACKWYAKREHVSVRTICSSIFDLNEPESYDLICTDAFLTRFPKDDIKRIIDLWYAALADKGSVVTTIRIHDERHVCPETPSELDIQEFRHKALERSKVWSCMINYSQEQVAEMAAVYAYKMKSNCVGDKSFVLNAFEEAGFTIAYIDDAEVRGELYQSMYLRIRAEKRKTK